MVITKQPQIGGEGNTLVKLVSAPRRDLTSFSDWGTRVRFSPGTQRLVSTNTPTRSFAYRPTRRTFLVRVSRLTVIFDVDLTYKQYTDPPSALGFWIPLEKCTSENGALSFLPGSHLTAPITKRFVRLPTGGTGFEQLPVGTNEAPPPTGKYVLECCEPGNQTRVIFAVHQLILLFGDSLGDLVLIHGSVLHKSEKNLSPKTRFAYTFHMIDSPPHATYDEKNWLQPTEAMPFSRILA